VRPDRANPYTILGGGTSKGLYFRFNIRSTFRGELHHFGTFPGSPSNLLIR